MRTITRAGSLAAIVAAAAMLLPVGAGAAEQSPGARPPAPGTAAAAEAGQAAQAEVTELTAGGPALVPGTWLVSANGRYRLGIDADGNLVVYGTSGDERPVPVYFTGTRTPGSSLVVQNDRNLVLRAPDGSPVWSSFTGRLR